jgi:hypothetical protein
MKRTIMYRGARRDAAKVAYREWRSLIGPTSRLISFNAFWRSELAKNDRAVK